MAAIDISGTNGPGLTLVTSADATTGFSGTSGQLDTTEKYQNTGAYTYQSGKSGRTSCTFTPATNLDWSLTDGHFYFTMKCAVFASAETKTTGTTTASGLTMRVTDGSGNYIEWHLAGSDTWAGGWKQFVVDLANTAEIYASSGTLVLTDIDVIEWFVDLSNSGNIRIIDNTWLDVMYFGTGIVVTGTDADFDAAFVICDAIANKYPILHKEEGVLFGQGAIQFGDGGSTSTTCTSDNEVVVFRDALVSATLLKIVSDDATMVVTSGTYRAAGATDTTRFAFDMALATDVTMSGSAFTRAGAVDFASGQDIQTCVFNDCDMVDPATAVFKFNSITNSNVTGAGTGALYLPLTNSVDDITFDANDRDVLIDESGTFSNITFDHGTNNFDLDYNNASDATFNTPSDGNTATVTNTGAGTLTIVSGAVTVRVVVRDLTGGALIKNARVYLTKVTGGAVVLNDLTNSSGIVEDGSYTYTGDEAVEGIVRKSNGEIHYVEGNLSGTIGSAGLVINISLIRD